MPRANRATKQRTKKAIKNPARLTPAGFFAEADG
jgi:hypothetical protein